MHHITITLVQIAYEFGLEVYAGLIGIQIQFDGGMDDCRLAAGVLRLNQEKILGFQKKASA